MLVEVEKAYTSRVNKNYPMSFRYPETATAIAYQTQGFFEQAQTSYEQVRSWPVAKLVSDLSEVQFCNFCLRS